MSDRAAQLSTDFKELFDAFYRAPRYHLFFEVALLLWVFWLLFFRKPRPIEKHLTEAEKQELIDEWVPEPLVPSLPDSDQDIVERDITGPVTKYVNVNGKNCINFASYNFLNLVGDERINKSAIDAVRKYGVGTCGPRGFYGTIDIHLELEERIAKFFRAEEAALYSYGFSTTASVIPAYAKRGDIIFADESVHFAIQKGLVASRSEIRLFKHNDVNDLIKLLEEQAEADAQNQTKAKATRRFLVVEGLYINVGDICPLPKYVELRKKYKFRIILDESISFGTLGRTGRGITEYFNVPIEDVDLICGSLEYAFGSSGGFSVGSSFVVDHQRLSSLGYCFSASLPPLFAAAVLKCFDIMEDNPNLFTELDFKSRLLNQKLRSIKGIIVSGSEFSPLKHLYLQENNCAERLEKIVKYAEEHGILLTQSKYLSQEMTFVKPSIRICVNLAHTEEEINNLIEIIRSALKSL